MRAAVLPILVIMLTVCAGPPEPAVIITVAEVVADRLLDGDPAGAARALAAVARV
jgi:hypothetical protein